MDELEYWKKRCELAENIEAANPCDPDINSDQIKAYKEYNYFLHRRGKKFYR